MKRWMVVMILAVVLALTGSVFAANSAGDLSRDDVLRAPILKEPADLEEASQDPADDNADRGGLVSPNGAIWPKGVW